MRYRFFALVFTLTGLLAACNLGAEAPTPTPAPSPTPTLTPQPPDFMQLTPYVSNQVGYRITYPTGLVLDEDKTSGFVTIDNQITIQVTGLNPADARGDAPVIESVAETTIAGEVSRRYSGYIGAIGGNTPQRYEMVSVPHNGLFYVFTVYELKIGDAQPENRAMNPVSEEALATFFQIVSSLEFVTPGTS
jgi:hypothetical protein